ncbi:MAG: hypothetical protein ABIL62_08570 [Planctomycetota bacterium]
MPNNKRKSKAKVLAEVHPFNKEQEKQLEEKPIKDIRQELDALDAWRKQSLARVSYLHAPDFRKCLHVNWLCTCNSMP